MTKNLGIPDSTDAKLDKIMQEKRFRNRADAVAWLIDHVHDQLFKGGAPA